MRHRFQHGLRSRRAVREIVQHAYEEHARNYPQHHPVIQWIADDRARIGFVILGRSLWATISIDDETLTLEGKVPLLFKPFEERVVYTLEQEVDEWLAKAHRGEIPSLTNE